MVKNKLFIPTLNGFRNMLRPIVESMDNNGVLLALFNPCSPGFDKIHQILEAKTDLLQIYESLEIIIPQTISI